MRAAPAETGATVVKGRTGRLPMAAPASAGATISGPRRTLSPASGVTGA